MTSSNGNIFPRYWLFVWGIHRLRWIPLTKASDADFFFELCQKKRLSKPSRRRWFETPSHLSWRHCNDNISDETSWHFTSSNEQSWPTLIKPLLCCLQNRWGSFADSFLPRTCTFVRFMFPYSFLFCYMARQRQESSLNEIIIVCLHRKWCGTDCWKWAKSITFL